MNINKFTKKETLIQFIETNLHIKDIEISKLYDGELTIDSDVLFQIRTKNRITLKDLSIIGLLHKDVSFIVNDDKQILLTWVE